MSDKEYKESFIAHGWTVVSEGGSTMCSIDLSPDLVGDMGKVNMHPGYLSSATVAFSSALLGDIDASVMKIVGEDEA